MRRFFLVVLATTFVLATVFLALGWHYVQQEAGFKSPVLANALSLWGDLIMVGLAVQQLVGYVKSDSDPAWWYPALTIGSSALILSLILAVVVTGIRATVRRGGRPRVAK